MGPQRGFTQLNWTFASNQLAIVHVIIFIFHLEHVQGSLMDLEETKHDHNLITRVMNESLAI